MVRKKKFIESGLILLAVLLLFAALASTGCSTPAKRSTLAAPPRAAGDNDIYVADSIGGIRALDRDGTERWSYHLADDLATNEPDASHDVRIDFLFARSTGKLFGVATELTGRRTGQRILFALNDRQLLWFKEIPYPESSVAPLAIGSEAVYLSGNDGVLYAYARSDGRQLWKHTVSQGALVEPTVGADGTIYVIGPQHNLHALSPDGTERWVVAAK
jgi:outer membrane protein assembly factor BamB